MMQAFFVFCRSRLTSDPGVCLTGLVQAAILLAFLLTSLSGCAPQPPAVPVHVIAGWDTSQGARPRLAAYVDLGGRLVRRFRGSGSHATLFRMDSSTTEFYDAAAPRSLESLQALLVRQLEPSAAHRGTYPARFWQVAAECAERSNTPVVITLLTDGGNDDRSPAALAVLQDGVRRLAANPRVQTVCVWGVLPSQRQELRADLALLGDRLQLRGLDDANPDAVPFPTQPLRH